MWNVVSNKDETGYDSYIAKQLPYSLENSMHVFSGSLNYEKKQS